jgi:hypothetical protein
MAKKQLVERFNQVYPGKLESIVNDHRLTLESGVATMTIRNNEGIDVCLMWSPGVRYHTDRYPHDNCKHSTILVLHNPGYEFRARAPKRKIHRHQKEFFSFRLDTLHTLAWAGKPKRKDRRENWIAIAIDADKFYSRKEFFEIVYKLLDEREQSLQNHG